MLNNNNKLFKDTNSSMICRINSFRQASNIIRKRTQEKGQN